MKDITLEEAWNGLKPSVEQFRVFGCVAHVNIPGKTNQTGKQELMLCTAGSESRIQRLQVL